MPLCSPLPSCTRAGSVWPIAYGRSDDMSLLRKLAAVLWAALLEGFTWGWSSANSQGGNEDLGSGVCKELRPANNSELEKDPLAEITTPSNSLRAHETPWAKTIQRGHFWIHNPQELCEITHVCYVELLLSFGLICYAAITLLSDPKQTNHKEWGS